EQVHDLRLDGYVQGRYRLVAHDQLRPKGDGPRNTDALPLAAGKLVRVAVVVLGVEADALHQRLYLGLDAFFRLDLLDPERGSDDRPDVVAWIKRRIRVLEDHLDVAPEWPHLVPLELRNLPALECDGAASGLEQSGDHSAGRRLATAGLTHQTERLAR